MKHWREIDKSFKIFLLGMLGLVLVLKFIEKDSLIGVINRSLPSTEASLMSGILWGDKSGMSKELLEQLRNSGLIHLVIVSGSNVMLLVGGLIEVLARLIGRKKAIIMGMLVGWWYVGIVGWEIPVVRAMLMISIYYFAQVVGRKFDVVRGLVLVVLILVVAESQVLSSLSFWLSMAAYIGVISLPAKFNQTIWISLWTTPILGMFFGKVSVVSPITNLLVIGLIEIITGLGIVFNVLGLFVFEIAKLGMWLLWPLIKFLSLVISLGGGSSSIMEVSFSYPFVIGWYLVLWWIIRNVSRKNNTI